MNKSRTLFGLAAVFLLSVLTVNGEGVVSHPYHVSNAEVNFNAATGNFEVALCVWPADLEKAIGQENQTPIDLDKSEDLDDLMKSYIEKRFLVRAARKDASSKNVGDAEAIPAIRWIGHEHDLKKAWLYFEVECDPSVANWTLENRVFFELNEDQLNQLELSVGNDSRVVVCRLGDSRVSVGLPQSK